MTQLRENVRLNVRVMVTGLRRVLCIEFAVKVVSFSFAREGNLQGHFACLDLVE